MLYIVYSGFSQSAREPGSRIDLGLSWPSATRPQLQRGFPHLLLELARAPGTVAAGFLFLSLDGVGSFLARSGVGGPAMGEIPRIPEDCPTLRCLAFSHWGFFDNHTRPLPLTTNSIIEATF